jgi:LPS O-antigen subunit length determinant protein (WzzB/FepE family)
MNLKKTAALCIVIAVAATVVWAQDFQEEALLRRLDIEKAEYDRILEINRSTQMTAQEAAAEQKILQARLEKLLLNPDPDIREIEDLLRESLEWKLKVEMARIKQSIEMRKILGEDRWLRFLRLRKEFRQRDR